MRYCNAYCLTSLHEFTYHLQPRARLLPQCSVYREIRFGIK